MDVLKKRSPDEVLNYIDRYFDSHDDLGGIYSQLGFNLGQINQQQELRELIKSYKKPSNKLERYQHHHNTSGCRGSHDSGGGDGIEDDDHDDEDDDDNDNDEAENRDEQHNNQPNHIHHQQTRKLSHKHQHHHHNQVDDEVEDDEYCSDETSNTSSTNGDEKAPSTRVCNCCYCGLFGNDSTSVTLSSSKYAIRRERMRLTLLHRRAQQGDNGVLSCQHDRQQNPETEEAAEARDCVGKTIGSNSTCVATKEPVVDQRNLDELLNYINGSDKKDRDKSNPKGKTANSKNSANQNKKSSKNNTSLNNSTNNSNGKNKNHLQLKSDKQSGYQTSKQHIDCANQQGDENHQPASSNKQKRRDRDKSTVGARNNNSSSSNGKIPKKVQQNSHHHSAPSHEAQHTNENIPDTKVVSPAAKSSNLSSLESGGSNIQKQAPSVGSKKGAQAAATGVAKRPSDEANEKRKTAPNKRDHADNGLRKYNNSSSNNANKNNSNSDSDGSKSNKTSSCQRNKHSLSAEGCVELEPCSLDEVFMPRDIDLNDAALDEVERELEAFKRFCFESVPLVKTVRVRVELKNAAQLRELSKQPDSYLNTRTVSITNNNNNNNGNGPSNNTTTQCYQPQAAHQRNHLECAP